MVAADGVDPPRAVSSPSTSRTPASPRGARPSAMIADGPRDASTARRSPIPPATSTSASASSVDGAPRRRPRAARGLRAEQARRRRLDRARHARAPDRRRARADAGGRASTRSGRLDADTDRPDPADERRRARQPPHAPALRGAEDLPRARRRRAARRARAAAAARGRRARGRPHGARRRSRRLGPRRARADDRARGATARCGACARPSGTRCSSCARVAFGPLRLGRPRAGRAPAPGSASVEVARARRAGSDRIAPHGDCSPCAARPPSSATTRRRSSARPTELMRSDHGAQRAAPGARWSAASSPPPTTSTPSSRRSPPAPSGSTACRCCARRRSPCPGSMPRVIRVLIHYHADDGHVARARLPRRRAGAARRPRTRHNRSA